MAGDRMLGLAAFLVTGAGILAFVLHVVPVWDFTVDDAYIVFRYARNLVEGAGPTFNADGHPVEGVTQVLWLGLMTIPHLLSMHVVLFAKVAGVLFSLATWALVFDLARGASTNAGGSRGQSLLAGGVAVAVIASLPVSALHAISGLGTALFACLLAAFVRACSAFTTCPGSRRASIVGVMGLLLGLARPEGNAFAAIAYAVMVLGTSRRGRTPLVRAALVFHALPGSLYFVGRWAYYGLPMPLPYYVKMQSTESFGAAGDPGLYLATEMSMYLAPVWGPLLLIGSAAVCRPLATGVLAASGFLALQTIPTQIMGYGWRYFFPALPVLAVVAGLGASTVVGWCRRIARSPASSAGLGAALGLVAVVACSRGRDPQLSPWVTYARGLERAHIALGDRLGRARGDIAEPRLSISDAGAVPYLSSWHTIDTFGLNDPRIAVRGEHRADRVISERPDVMVLISSRDDEFDPWLPWEANLHGAALEAGYSVVKVLEFSTTYFLWILCPEQSPAIGQLMNWHPESEVPDPFGTLWSGPGAATIGKATLVEVDQDFGVLRVVDALVTPHHLVVRVRKTGILTGPLRVFVHVVDPSGPGTSILQAYDFDPEPPITDLGLDELQVYRTRLLPPTRSGALIRLGFFDPVAPPYPRLMDRDGRDHVELRMR